MTIHVCSLDPCARWKPQPARIFVDPYEVDGSLRDVPVYAEGRTAMNARETQPTH